MDGEDGNSCHLHMSLYRNIGTIETNVVGDKNGNYGLTKQCESFIAGILNHYRALMPFLAPSPNSDRRMKSGYQAPTFRCWGFENREASIRVVDL